MGSPIEDLSEWVAVKANIFHQSEEADHSKFICAWNQEELKFAITLHEGSRKASDHTNKNKVCLLSMKELYHIHHQFYLINTSLVADFPKEIKPNYVPSRKKFESLSSGVEYYLGCALRKVGKKLVKSLLFGDDDPLKCYEENWNELRQKNLDETVDSAYKELEEILSLRLRAEALLQVTTIYALEDEISLKIFDSVSELYNFHLHPFLELREMAHIKVKQAKEKLSEEIGPKIKQKAEKDFEEWNEQSLVATEAIQQLYQEFYRKTLNLVVGQRDRMLSDQKKFGKAAFELHAMPRLLKLEVMVCQEDLKLQNAIKATKEYQRDKIKSQLTYLSYDYGAVHEIGRIEEEITNAQIGVFDAHLDVLEAEERLYKSQLAVLNKEYKDKLETGVFFDAVENPEDLDHVNIDTPDHNPKSSKLKEKLNKIYRKRAFIRNKKKTMVTDLKEKKAMKASVIEKNEKAATVTRKRKESKVKELPPDKLQDERRKTLQRLKQYKKKALKLESKDQAWKEESDMTTSTLSVLDNPDTITILTPKKPRPPSVSKVVNPPIKTVPQKPPDLPSPPESLTSLPPPPPPPPPPPSIPPPPPPPPPPSIPPPPPPPPPPPGIPLPTVTSKVNQPKVEKTASNPTMEPISQDAIAGQLKVLKKAAPPPPREVKNSTPGSFSLNEILAMRSKLKAPPPVSEDKGRVDTPMDLSTILQATMKRIRNVCEGSDLEDSDSHSDSDFD